MKFILIDFGKVGHTKFEIKSLILMGLFKIIAIAYKILF
jgi:hypothetical protein